MIKYTLNDSQFDISTANEIFIGLLLQFQVREGDPLK